MRENNGNSKKLDELTFTRYEVEGLNQSALLNTLVKRGVSVKKVKKLGAKKMRLSISSSENEKFFAITQELCYNIKKTGEYGRIYPLVYLKRHVGALVGIILFIVSVIFANDIIFAFEFTGTGAVLENEVRAFLKEEGVSPFGRFSRTDCKKLSKNILRSNPKLSYAGVKRNGLKLSFELALSDEPIKNEDTEITKLVSDTDGVVKEIKVYRGTAAVKVGDEVVAGDVLVDGYAIIKDVRVEVNVIATVTVEYYRTAEVVLYCDDGEEIAEAFASAEYEENEISSVSVKKDKKGEQYIYTVCLALKKVITG